MTYPRSLLNRNMVLCVKQSKGEFDILFDKRDYPVPPGGPIPSADTCQHCKNGKLGCADIGTFEIARFNPVTNDVFENLFIIIAH